MEFKIKYLRVQSACSLNRTAVLQAQKTSLQNRQDIYVFKLLRYRYLAIFLIVDTCLKPWFHVKIKLF